MRDLIKDKRGISLVEIMVSAILLTIAAAASYAAFLSISTVNSLSMDEFEANVEVGGWIEQVRTGATADMTYEELVPTADWIGLNDNESVLETDFNDWELASRRGVDPTTLNAGYRVTNENFHSGTDYEFRKVELRVQWNEKR